jgi:hypothetical protein
MHLWVAIFALAASCGYSVIGANPPPRVRAHRPISLEVDVEGEPRELIDDAVKWVLRGDSSMKRVRGGGDACLRLEGRLSEKRAILAGTDASFRLTLVAVRGNEEVLRDMREWSRENISSGVPAEEEKMVADAVTWALGRAAATLGEEPKPAPLVTPVAAPAPAPEYDDTPTPIQQPKRKKRK